MNFNCIIANPPYGKIGVDVTKNVIKQNPDSNYAMLGTRSMFKAFYADTLACQFVQIGRYELGSNVKLDWGVEQAILLATNGWTEVVDNRKKGGKNLVGTAKSPLELYAQTHLRTSHLVGSPVSIERVAWNHRARNAHLVGVDQLSPNFRGFSIGRTSHLVQLPLADTAGAAATHSRSTTLVTDKDDQHLRSGYLYVSFETFEEACECAIDIISWKNPTDSHYRCIRWGFVQGLKAHERYKEDD